MEAKKKPTFAQLERRIKNALVFIPRTKDTESIYFVDKGLKIEVTDDYCVISTQHHKHVFDSINVGQGGYSRPWLYTKRVVEIALENDCKVEGGHSFQRLTEVLKEKSERSEYNIVIYFSWWTLLIFNNLYSIGEDEVTSWLTYFKYVSALAINSILLEEHKEDVTNRQFIDQFCKNVKEFTDNIDEEILLHKLTDEELIKQNIEAAQEMELNRMTQQENQ